VDVIAEVVMDEKFSPEVVVLENVLPEVVLGVVRFSKSAVKEGGPQREHSKLGVPLTSCLKVKSCGEKNW